MGNIWRAGGYLSRPRPGDTARVDPGSPGVLWAARTGITPQAERASRFRQRGGAVVVYEVRAAQAEFNPTAERLRELTEKMPNSQLTEFDNVVVKARVDSRSTRSTFVVDDSTNATSQTITREEYDRISATQDSYIAGEHMVVVDGFIGSDPQFRTRARLIMEAANANVAGMQRQLYYPVEADYDPATWQPDTTVIYTPNLPAPG